MAAVDFDGPLDDFYNRTGHISRIMAVVEAASKTPGALGTNRPNIDLAGIGLQTENTANSMAIVFLASSFEEFVREEIGQCADFLSVKYPNLAESSRIKIRGTYWSSLLARMNFSKSILTKSDPKVIDVLALGKVRGMVDSANGFIINDDSSKFERENFFHHSHNFRPHVVDELAKRVGIDNIVDAASDNARLKTYFAVTKKSDCAKKLREKLDAFYEKRNLVVHSLNGSTGEAVDVVLDYINVLKMTAESIVAVIKRVTASW
jgi:hypothetical protein